MLDPARALGIGLQVPKSLQLKQFPTRRLAVAGQQVSTLKLHQVWKPRFSALRAPRGQRRTAEKCAQRTQGSKHCLLEGRRRCAWDVLGFWVASLGARLIEKNGCQGQWYNLGPQGRDPAPLAFMGSGSCQLLHELGRYVTKCWCF